MFVLDTAAMPWDPVKANTRTGKISRKFIREGELAPGVGYTSDLVKYHDGHGVFTAPRHRHNFDQIRLTLSGETDYGYEQIAGAGDATFFPAGAYYGPERFEAAEILVLQWSPDWVTRERSDAAYAELAKTGQFKEGFYVSVGNDGQEVRKDGTNAVWEAVNGKPLVIPSPKYQQPILMRPEGFEWDEQVRRRGCQRPRALHRRRPQHSQLSLGRECGVATVCRAHLYRLDRFGCGLFGWTTARREDDPVFGLRRDPRPVRHGTR